MAGLAVNVSPVMDRSTQQAHTSVHRKGTLIKKFMVSAEKLMHGVYFPVHILITIQRQDALNFFKYFSSLYDIKIGV